MWPHIDSKQEHTHTHSSLADQTDGTDPGWVCRFYFSTWTDQDSQHHHLLHIPSGLHLPSSPLGLRLQQLARRSASIKWSKKTQEDQRKQEQIQHVQGQIQINKINHNQPVLTPTSDGCAECETQKWSYLFVIYCSHWTLIIFQLDTIW